MTDIFKSISEKNTFEYQIYSNIMVTKKYVYSDLRKVG